MKPYNDLMLINGGVVFFNHDISVDCPFTGGVAIAEQDDEEEEELDEATRQFNFWTHQVHIFFVRKFFPAAEKFLQLRQLVEQRNIAMSKQKIAETPSRRESVKVKWLLFSRDWYFPGMHFQIV